MLRKVLFLFSLGAKISSLPLKSWRKKAGRTWHSSVTQLYMRQQKMYKRKVRKWVWKGHPATRHRVSGTQGTITEQGHTFRIIMHREWTARARLLQVVTQSNLPYHKWGKPREVWELFKTGQWPRSKSDEDLPIWPHCMPRLLIPPWIGVASVGNPSSSVNSSHWKPGGSWVCWCTLVGLLREVEPGRSRAGGQPGSTFCQQWWRHRLIPASEGEGSKSLSSRPAWSTKQVSGQRKLLYRSLALKNKETNKQKVNP